MERNTLAALALLLMLGCTLGALAVAAAPWFAPEVFGKEPSAPASEVHPVILYTASEEAAIAEKIGREPYKGWFEKLNKTARKYSAMKSSEFSSEYERAAAAKILSFAYVFGGKNSRFAAKAEELLMAAGEKTYSNFVSDYNLGLAYYAESYDMLKGADWEFGDEKRVRDRISAQMELRMSPLDSLIAYPGEFGSIASLFCNHELRRASSVGIAALSTIGEGKSRKALLESQSAFSRVVKWQTGGLGGWGEGPHYFAYSMALGFPFMRALKNARGPDLFKNVAWSSEWAYNITQPDGSLPNYDDSETQFPYWQLWGGAMKQKYIWWWKNARKPYAGADDGGPLAPDSIASYEDSALDMEPAYPRLLLMPDTTGAVFRSGSAKNATYLLLLAENGAAASPGIHEHPDGLSVLFFANGTALVADSGYYAFGREGQNRERRPYLVNRPKNHNVLLVDSIGQNRPFLLHQSEAYAKRLLGFEDIASESWLSKGYYGRGGGFACASALYAGAALERCVADVGGEYFAIFDRVDFGREAKISALFHTGSLQARISEGGAKAEWEKNGQFATLFSSVMLKSETQDYSENGMAAHQSTLVAEKNSRGARFAFALFAGAQEMELERAVDANCTLLTLSRDGGKDYLFSCGGTRALHGELRTDAEWAIVRTANNSAKWALWRNASLVEFGGQTLHESNLKGDGEWGG